MSQPRPDLSNSKSTAKKYVDWLSGVPQVVRILLAGSRSSKREKQPTATSDWDFVVVYAGVRKLLLPDPRKQFGFHADVLMIREGRDADCTKADELYRRVA